MITAQDILTELGKRAWSGFNKDDMIFGTEDCQQAQAELNSAVRYLVNLEDFIFKSREKQLKVNNGKYTFAVPEGQINTIYNYETKEILTYLGSGVDYDLEAIGSPSGYWVETKGQTQTIRLYPVPEESYDIRVVYNQYKPVIGADGFLYNEFKNAEDYINMPMNLEHLFKDCLVLRTMITNNKDDQDENYQPMIREFEEAWRVFKKASKPARIDNRIVW